MDDQSNIKRLKLKRHPVIWLLKGLREELALSRINFSRYTYLPQTYEDHRQTFSVNYEDIDINRFLALITYLEPNQDLALHSNVIVGQQTYHIPMIDFGGKNQSMLNIHALHHLQHHWSMELAIYHSGRSYHAYGNRLLSNDQWIKFMGSLLLLNEPNAAKMIDTRWIGHRIMAGYSALRWSCNGKQYKKFPTYLGLLSELK